MTDKAVRDPWAKPVTRGQFGFNDALGRFFRIVPVNSDSQLFTTALSLLRESGTRALRDLVIVVDEDNAAETRISQFESLKLRMPEQSTARLSLAVLGGRESGPGVPDLAGLEKIVCAAIAGAYPERAVAVSSWLQTVGAARRPAESAKQHSCSYMAGWYAEQHCDQFFREVWRDDRIRAGLIEALQANGAWESVVGALT